MTSVAGPATSGGQRKDSCPTPAGPALTHVLRPQGVEADGRSTWAAVVAAYCPAPVSTSQPASRILQSEMPRRHAVAASTTAAHTAYAPACTRRDSNRPAFKPLQAAAKQYGFYAMIFGVPRQCVMGNGGLGLKLVLGKGVRQAANKQTANALHALMLGRVTWLGDMRAPEGRRHPVRITMRNVPAIYTEALRAQGREVNSYLRTLGWRVVVCEDGMPIAPAADSRQHTSMFAPLADDDIMLSDSLPSAAVADATAEAQRSRLAMLDGRIIKKRFDGVPYYGMAHYMPAEEAPFVFTVTFTDMDQELMTEKGVRRLLVAQRNVPAHVHAQLRSIPADYVAPHLQLEPQQQPLQQPRQQQLQRPPQQRSQQRQQQQQQQQPLQSEPHRGQQHAQNRAPVDAAHRRAAAARRRRSRGQARAAVRTWCSAGLTVGTLNVCGLTRTKATDLAELLESTTIDVLGITETHEGKCAIHPISGYTFVGKQRTSGGQGGGVGFYVSDAVLPLVQPHMQTAVEDSMWLVIPSMRAGAPAMCLGLIYLPPSKLQTAESITNAYALLQQDVNTYNAQGRVFLMGDFNSRVGKAATEGEHIGKWGELTTNAAGTALTSLLNANDLFALNGRQQCDAPAYTRHATKQHADGTTHTEQAVLDYMIVPREFALSGGGELQNVCKLQVEPRWKVHNTDHLLLWTNIPHMTRTTDMPKRVVRRPNTYKLALPSGMREEVEANRAGYKEAVEEAMIGYEAFVDNLDVQVGTGRMQAQEAVYAARDALFDRIMWAVSQSIGFNTKTGRGKKLVRTPAVQAAVQLRKEADEHLTAMNAAAQQPTSSAMAAQLAEAVREAEVAYVQATKGVKKVVAEARKARKADIARKAETCAAKADGKGVWKAMKQLAGGKYAKQSKGPAAVQTASGNVVVEPQVIANTFAQHYERVTDPQTFAQSADFDEQHYQHIEALAHQRRSHTSFVEVGGDALSAPFTAEEVILATLALSNWKAPSPIDGINNELLKYGGPAMQHCLTVFFNLEWQLECKAVTPGVIRSLHKKGDTMMPNNYRPITLGSALDKLYNTILNKRVYKHLEATGGLHEAQQGFREGRNTNDNILMLMATLNARKQAKLTTYLLFLDIEKAYDSVWRAGLLHHVWEAGIKGRMYRVLAQMCDSATSMVLHEGCMSPQWKPGMGWEQGDTLATTMFNIHVNAILTTLWQQHPGVSVPGTDVQKMVALMFADDLVATAASSEALQQLVHILQAELRRWRMKASVSAADASKTAVMVVGRRAGAGVSDEQNEWKWGDIIIPQVQKYKYLGVWVTADGKWDEHIAARFASADKAAHAMYGCMTAKKMPWHMRKMAFTGAVCPTALYASEVWCKHTQETSRKMDSWQMQKVASMVHCPPKATYACLQQELGIIPMHITSEIRSLVYWHRVQSMPASRMTKQVANAWVGVKNPWLSAQQKLLHKYGLDEGQVLTLTKQQFKNLVENKAAERVLQGWTNIRGERGTVLSRYNTAYGCVHAKHVGDARGYFQHLSAHKRGAAAELCMKLRVECLSLHAMHSHRRGRETLVAQQQRELCPCCKQASETAHHFLFGCSSYNQQRMKLTTALQQVAPAKFTELMGMQQEQQWRQLLNDTFWELNSSTNNRAAMEAVAAYVAEAWAERKKGGAAGQQTSSTQAGGVFVGFSPPGQRSGATQGAAIARIQSNVRGPNMSPRAASNQHDAALTGRETNGLTAFGVM